MGLSPSAFAVEDPQSDKGAVARLNPGLLKGQWTDPGAAAPMLLSALMVSCWGGSKKLPRSEILFNACVCYYWTLANMAQSRAAYGQAAHLHWLPPQTSRSICALCGHAILAALEWPADVVYAPRLREERVMESFFSKVKSRFRGSPSLRDGIQGAHCTHLEQMKQGPPLPDRAWQAQAPLSSVVALSIVKKALQTAAVLQASFSRDKTPRQVLDNVATYWAKEGCNILTGDMARQDRAHLQTLRKSM